MNQIVFDTTTRIWAQREKRPRERGMERITEDLWCLSPPVREPFLWQARKYFFDLSPRWHQHVTGTYMPPLTLPAPLTFPALLFVSPAFKSACNDAARWKWWEEEKERLRGEKNEEKKSPVCPVSRASGIPWLWKMCARHLFILLQREVFQEAQGLRTHSLELTSHLWLA